jgi:dCTP deaminase
VILAYQDLLRGWKTGRLRFTPDISNDQIGLSSIDLRLGWVFTCLLPKSGVVIQPARSFDPTGLVEHQDFSQMQVLGQSPRFRIKPGEFHLAFTLEEVAVPHTLAANVQGKSSLARAGLAVHITAPHIHSGWSGRITLELYNHGSWELELVPGEDHICQVIYYRVQTPVSKRVATALGTYVQQPTPFPVRPAPVSTARTTKTRSANRRGKR